MELCIRHKQTEPRRERAYDEDDLEADDMSQNWVMAPAEYAPNGEAADIFWKHWEYDLANDVIAMGWDLGKKSDSREHLYSLWEKYAPPEWNRTRQGKQYESTPHGLKMLERFWFDIEPGDMVVARAGITRYVGIGEFQEEPFYVERSDGLEWGCSFRQVRWELSPGIRPSPVKLTQATLYSLQPEKFRQFRSLAG